MRLFCFGYGYSALALVREHRQAWSAVWGTVRDPAKAEALRREGLGAIVLDGGEAAREAMVAALAESTHLIVSAAPGPDGDPLLHVIGAAPEATRNLAVIVYLSTIGVYGDHGGAWIDESAPLAPGNPRGVWRVAAEEAWSRLGAARGIAVQQHRLGGIYGPGRNPLIDLRDGSARRIIKPGQVFNRIHVTDIACAAMAGFAAPHVEGAFNIVDDEPAPPQDVVLHAATLLGVAPPPEVPFDGAALSEMARQFYSQNRRVRNERARALLGWRPRYPSYREGLAALLAAGEGR